jgi:hypothetical protein
MAILVTGVFALVTTWYLLHWQVLWVAETEQWVLDGNTTEDEKWEEFSDVIHPIRRHNSLVSVLTNSMEQKLRTTREATNYVATW